MMKKTTQRLLLVFSTLLLLVSVTASAQGQPGSATDRLRGNAPATGNAQDRRSNNADFSGTWNTVTSKGKKIVMRLAQGRGYIVTGSYGVNGLTGSNKPLDRSISVFVKVSASTAEPVLQNQSWIKGTVTGNVLRFTWVEDGGQGAGRFTLSSDGESFEGTLSASDNPDDTSGGTWNGTRLHSFAGAWHAKLGEGALELILQQAGIHVTGQVKINSADVGVIREGIVVGNTLRFKIVRVGRTSGVLTDEFVGSGELVMDAGGKSFTGHVLGTATSGGTFIGR